MTRNRLHLVVLLREATLLAKDIDQMHFRYTQYFNSKNKRSGHLWQNMFYSVVSKAMHLVCAMWYFERNPAGTVQPLKRICRQTEENKEGRRQ